MLDDYHICNADNKNLSNCDAMRSTVIRLVVILAQLFSIHGMFISLCYIVNCIVAIFKFCLHTKCTSDEPLYQYLNQQGACQNSLYLWGWLALSYLGCWHPFWLVLHLEDFATFLVRVFPLDVQAGAVRADPYSRHSVRLNCEDKKVNNGDNFLTYHLVHALLTYTQCLFNRFFKILFLVSKQFESY